VLLVGLTGGIGSGKSEVARRLAERGAVIVDSDRIAHEVVVPGSPGLDAVVGAFGAQMLRPDGQLDRDRLGAVVFQDEAARARLNAIVHPLVGARTAELISAAAASDPDAIVVNDVPLLVEAGIADRYEVVVVVACDPAVQLDRLVRLRGMSETDARARISAQAPLEAKLAVADVVIRNDGGLDQLDREVEQAWAVLRDRAGRRMQP
jgi:dephospho-CoA kinase